MVSPYAKWVRLFTALLVLATFVLITTGGAVTSRNAGLAVPDWPTSFGRWLVIPLKLWADMGVFLEHNHRLTGALAGLIAIGAYVVVGRMFGFRSRVGWLAAVVLILYVVQGVLGGLRVTERSIGLAIIHGVSGQVVLALTVVLAVVVRYPWQAGAAWAGKAAAWTLIGVIVLQLILGATIRHTHSASSIPDAPLAYGSLLPPTDPQRINRMFYELGGADFRVYVEEPAAPLDATETPHTLAAETRPADPPTLGQIQLQYAHRVIGVLLLPVMVVALGYWLARQRAALEAARSPLLWLTILWLVQVLLGLSVIWSRERWEIATGHQAVGALFLAVATWLAVRLHCPPEVSSQRAAAPGANPAAARSAADATATA